MSNSSLVSYTKISPNKTSPRNHAIDTITIHCYVGQASVESMGGWLGNPSAQASANYGIGVDGRIGLFVEEKDRSWCSSSSSNDNRAITIECASDKTEPYAINDKVYNSLIKLCADICKRNNIKELKWKADPSLIGQVDKQNMTVHRWFKNKACPGEYIYSRLGKIASEVNALLGSGSSTSTPTSGLQAKTLANLSEKEVVEKVGPLCTNDQKKTGILASVSMAQFILESGYGKTDLAQNANNCFGMKKTLSGNTWTGSTWDGVSVYTKTTKECYDGVNFVDVKADFRKYPCVEKSIADHSAYLLGAKNGDKYRYEGLKGCTDYKKAIQIIKDGGYATDPDYVRKICNIIERWGLTKFNATNTATTEEVFYRVRKTWSDSASQKGAFTNLENAKKCADSNPGYSVFDASGNKVYTGYKSRFIPYQVKVSSKYLNIRKGPGIDKVTLGRFTGIGVFTIVDEADGPGASKWGLLKSYEKNRDGWISLDYAKRV